MLVDTNVILDILTDEPRWAEWSSEHLAIAGPKFINAFIYAELAGSHSSRHALDETLEALELPLVEAPCQALFLAGQTFRAYRERGGQRARVLADFVIGAHALVAGVPLLTRNGADFKRRFPKLQLIAPDEP